MITIFKRPSEAEIKAAVDAWYATHHTDDPHVYYTGPSEYIALEGYAQILVRRRRMPGGVFEVTTEWFGPADAPARVPEELWLYFREALKSFDDLPQEITFLPWPLRLIEGNYNFIPLEGIYVRTDDAANPLTFIYWKTYATARRGWRWFSLRALVTLAVWGMADWQPDHVRSWRHAFGPQRRKLRALLRRAVTEEEH